MVHVEMHRYTTAVDWENVRSKHHSAAWIFLCSENTYLIRAAKAQRHCRNRSIHLQPEKKKNVSTSSWFWNRVSWHRGLVLYHYTHRAWETTDQRKLELRKWRLGWEGALCALPSPAACSGTHSEAWGYLIDTQTLKRIDRRIVWRGTRTTNTPGTGWGHGDDPGSAVSPR